MANREHGEVVVKVGNKDYTLRPTFNSLCEYERISGKTPEDFLEGMERGTFSGLRISVWCLLQKHHRDEIRTIDDAGDWIEAAGGVDVVLAHLKQIGELNSDTVSGGPLANPPRARAGTGKRSSSRRSKSA